MPQRIIAFRRRDILERDPDGEGMAVTHAEVLSAFNSDVLLEIYMAKAKDHPREWPVCPHCERPLVISSTFYTGESGLMQRCTGVPTATLI